MIGGPNLEGSLLLGHGVDIYGEVWSGFIRLGGVWYGTARYGAARYRTMRSGQVRCSKVRFGLDFLMSISRRCEREPCDF